MNNPTTNTKEQDMNDAQPKPTAADDEWTPTTDFVRETWGDARWDPYGERPYSEHLAEFDRWLAEHDAQVAAQALRDASNALDLPGSDASGYYAGGNDSGYREAERHTEVWLNTRADRVAAGDQP